MSKIVSEGAPVVRIQKVIHSVISCPNCHEDMALKPSVDQGNVVQCEACKKMTYYPFERPWRRNGKAVALWIGSMVVSFVLGLVVNIVYDQIKPQTPPVADSQANQDEGK